MVAHPMWKVGMIPKMSIDKNIKIKYYNNNSNNYYYEKRKNNWIYNYVKIAEN